MSWASRDRKLFLIGLSKSQFSDCFIYQATSRTSPFRQRFNVKSCLDLEQNGKRRRNSGSFPDVSANSSANRISAQRYVKSRQMKGFQFVLFDELFSLKKIRQRKVWLCKSQFVAIWRIILVKRKCVSGNHNFCDFCRKWNLTSE